MRKLTRKNLDELAKVMPVISEVEQATYNGGTVYCDLSGHYLGKVGMGDDLKFISSTDFEYYQTNNIEGAGMSFKSLDNGAQYSFIINNSQFKNAQILGHGPNDSAAGLGVNGELAINEDHFVWNNYQDAISTLEHEAYHYENKHYTGVATVDNEIETILYQISTNAFATTSYEYKKYTAEYLYSKYLEKGDYSKTKAEIYQMVGINY